MIFDCEHYVTNSVTFEQRIISLHLVSSRNETLAGGCLYRSSSVYSDKLGVTLSIPYGTMTVKYPLLRNNSSRQWPGKSITFIVIPLKTDVVGREL